MLSVDTEVLSAVSGEGFKRLGDLKVGDKVFKWDGTVDEIPSVGNVKTVPGYRVTFEGGGELYVDSDHLWHVVMSKDIKKMDALNGEFTSDWYADASVGTCEQMLDVGIREKRSKFKFHIPTNLPVHFVGVPGVSVPPYAVGAYLARGMSYGQFHKPQYTESYLRDMLRREVVGQIIPEIVDVFPVREHKNNHKIPAQYMYGTQLEREEFLKGVCDTAFGKSGSQMNIAMSAPHVAAGVHDMLAFRGDKPNLWRNARGRYHISWTPYSAPLYMRDIHFNSTALGLRTRYRNITGIESVGEINCREIRVNHLLASRDLITVRG